MYIILLVSPNNATMEYSSCSNWEVTYVYTCTDVPLILQQT